MNIKKTKKITFFISIILTMVLIVEIPLQTRQRTSTPQLRGSKSHCLALSSQTAVLKETAQIASLILILETCLKQSSIDYPKNQETVDTIIKLIKTDVFPSHIRQLASNIASIYLEEDGFLYIDYKNKNSFKTYRLKTKSSSNLSSKYKVIESISLNNNKYLERVVTKINKNKKVKHKKESNQSSWREQEHAKYYSQSEKLYLSLLFISFAFLSLFYYSLFPIFFDQWTKGEYIWLFFHTIRLLIPPIVFLGSIHLVAMNFMIFLDILMGKSKEDTKFTSFTVPSMPPKKYYPSATSMVPVYNEDWNVIKQNLDALMITTQKYNQTALKRALELLNQPPKNIEKIVDAIEKTPIQKRTKLEQNLLSAYKQKLANIVVCDDYLMPLCNNQYTYFLNKINWKISFGQILTNNEEKFITRVNYYKKNNITFVSRPTHNSNFGDWTFTRRGLFKKGSNLNHTHLLEERIQSLKQNGYSYADAFKIAQNTPVKQKNKSIPLFAHTTVEGELYIGDLILLLDKDSVTPEDVLWKTAREFVKDPLLAYTQNETKTVSPTNYVEYIISIGAEGFHSFRSLAKAKYGFVTFIGHNGILRKENMKKIGYWDERFVSEDYDIAQSLSNTLDPKTKQWHYGKGIFYPGEIIQEGMASSFSSQSVQIQKFGVGSTQLWTNPFIKWFKGKIINDKFLKFITAKHIPWHTRLDHFLSAFIMMFPIMIFSNIGLEILMNYLSISYLYPVSPLYITYILSLFFFSFVILVVLTHISRTIKDKNKSLSLNEIIKIIFKSILDVSALSFLYGGLLFYGLLGSASYLFNNPKTCSATPTDKPNYDFNLFESISYILKNNLSAVLTGGFLLSLFVTAKGNYNIVFLLSIFNGSSIIIFFLLLSPFLFEPSFINSIKKFFSMIFLQNKKPSSSFKWKIINPFYLKQPPYLKHTPSLISLVLKEQRKLINASL